MRQQLVEARAAVELQEGELRAHAAEVQAARLAAAQGQERAQGLARLLDAAAAQRDAALQQLADAKAALADAQARGSAAEQQLVGARQARQAAEAAHASREAALQVEASLLTERVQAAEVAVESLAAGRGGGGSEGPSTAEAAAADAQHATRVAMTEAAAARAKVGRQPAGP